MGDHTFRDEPRGIYRHTTTPVSSFLPNAWGLYDMHGNVWEFCADRWQNDYTGAPVDGSARREGFRPGERESYRTARGGSWHEPPLNCRSAVRLKVNAQERMEYYGFRVALFEEELPI